MIKTLKAPIANINNLNLKTETSNSKSEKKSKISKVTVRARTTNLKITAVDQHAITTQANV